MSCKLKVVVSLLRIIATLLSLRPFDKYVYIYIFIEPFFFNSPGCSPTVSVSKTTIKKKKKLKIGQQACVMLGQS